MQIYINLNKLLKNAKIFLRKELSQIKNKFCSIYKSPSYDASNCYKIEADTKALLCDVVVFTFLQKISGFTLHEL